LNHYDGYSGVLVYLVLLSLPESVTACPICLPEEPLNGGDIAVSCVVGAPSYRPHALGCCKAVHHLVAALSVQVHVIMCFHGDADARLMDAFS
jgi:hypothetical protein